MPVVAVEVLDEALVADLEQPRMEPLSGQARLLPPQPLEQVLLPLELVRLAIPGAIGDEPLQGGDGRRPAASNTRGSNVCMWRLMR